MSEQALDFTQQFIAFAIDKQVLRFGEFKTKAGRLSPYFFNAGLFNDGESLMKLGEYYAAAIVQSGIPFDMLFGPAYKGITLAASISSVTDETSSDLLVRTTAPAPVGSERLDRCRALS